MNDPCHYRMWYIRTRRKASGCLCTKNNTEIWMWHELHRKTLMDETLPFSRYLLKGAEYCSPESRAHVTLPFLKNTDSALGCTQRCLFYAIPWALDGLWVLGILGAKIVKPAGCQVTFLKAPAMEPFLCFMCSEHEVSTCSLLEA